MRFLNPLLLSLSLFSLASAQGLEDSTAPKQKHGYQSDVSRLRNIVINSLYSHRDVFLRELISNANDAIEKLRLTSLKDKEVYDGSYPLNITIKAVKNEDGKGGRVIITDTGIGMTPEELTNNLGTLAKSGTTEFLSRAENSDGTGTGNLIGAFGLGFYSSFLVADKVYVASVPPKTAKNPNPQQYVFSSNADESAFETYPDPRGNTLGHGTEITLVLKEDAAEYADDDKLNQLISKHSSFSTSFPIYLWVKMPREVPDEDAEAAATETSAETAESPEAKSVKEADEAVVEDEATVEDVTDEKPAEEVKPKTKTIEVDEWLQVNPQQPVWVRDPKEVTDEEYHTFYHSAFKDYDVPLAWHHFSGEASGTSFRAIIYVPKRLDDTYWKDPTITNSKDFRLMVKRVFITSDLGDNFLPKWAGWVKVIVDADDLPLNVSRETLQSTRFLKQIKSIVLRRLLQTLKRVSEENPERFEEISKVYGGAFKLGSVEDSKNRDKVVELVRFASNQRNVTSLDQYVENKKQGQKQIFYLADMGKPVEQLQKSIFVEKLDARGYEVLLLNEPLDEIMLQNIRTHKKMIFQDVAKAGLKFGDEDDAEKEAQKAIEEKFKPLVDYLKLETVNIVRSVVVSDRLVTSPVAIVADSMGYTANVERLINAQNKRDNTLMHDFAKRQRILEINPRSPLIEGLLRRVEELPTDEDEKDVDAEEELREVVAILLDGALVRSGYEVPDSNLFFSRVDRVLRRSLGVSETAKADATVKPAPPVDPTLEPEEQEVLADTDGEDVPGIKLPEHLKDKVQIDMEEIPEDEHVHDEL